MSFTSEFETLLNEKKKREAQQAQKAQIMIGLFNAYSQELAAKQQAPEPSGIEILQAGALDDGYQFGDIAKIILGTAGDAAVNVGKGVTRFSEGIADNILYGIGDAAELFGYTDADLSDFRRRTAASTTDKVFGGVDNYLDQYSVLGRSSDAILEGAGQAAAIVGLGGFGAGAGMGTVGTTALTTGTSFVSGAGSGRGEAYQGGATDEESRTYGTISGAADAITELIFGGLGKGVKTLGIGKGLTSADDMLAKTLGNKVTKVLSKVISNEKVLRAIGNTAELGVKMSAEGMEEVLAGLAQAVGKKITYMSEEDLGKIIQDENLLEQFLVGAATSGIMQGGDLHRANKTSTDLVTGLTKNEQAVVDKEVENRIKQEEKGGKKISGKEKSKIYDQVVHDMERGYISTETIESVLGKDALSQYDTLSKEAEEFKTLYETEGGKLSEKQKDRLAELKEKNKANPYEQLLKSRREKISNDVSTLARNDRLGESYNEQIRKGEKFQADASKYSEAQRKTVQNAIDSGVLNNTNRSHEFVDLIAKISADKGIFFDFADNAKLKESGFALDGVLVNGFVNESGVTINIQSAKALNRVVGHEITHVLEGTELYDALQSAVTEYAKGKKEYDSRLKELTELYKGKNANVEQELVADLVGDYLFTDADFIKHLSTEHRNLAQKIYDEIKYLCKIVTAGTKEARQLEKVKKAFADAYRAETKNPTADGGVRYSLGQYSDAQKENWKNSKKIVIYENDAQLLQFVKDSIANKDAANKMYFGIISGDLAKRIKADTGLDFNGKNAVLRAMNVRKILLHDHGNVESEKLRGQVAVTETDFLAIKDIFGDPDIIKPEAQGYNGKPAATFEKVIGDKKYTMFVVDSGGSLDIFVQTMYIHKQKGSIANVANAKALTSTPKATVGTAPTTNVQQNNPAVKQQNSLSKKDFSIAPPIGADVHGKDIGYDIAPPVPESVLRANKARPKVGDPAYAPIAEKYLPKVNPEDSTGTAPSGFDPVSHLQYEYGSLPEGEKPAREDSLPKSTNGKDKVSLTGRTVKGAEATPDALVDLLDKTVVEGGLSYIPLSNDATVQKAYDRIKNLGWEEALADWKANVRAGKVSAELSATGALLLNNAANAGDRAVWLDVLHEYQQMGTSAAQAVQALRILKTLAPEDKLYMIHKSVDQMNRDSGYDVEVNEDLLHEWDEAETDTERDEVLDAIMQNVADQIPATFMEKFTALRYVNMLGNLRTQVRNVAGNLSMKGVRSIHNTIATGLEAIADTVSGGKTGRTRAVTVSKEQKAAAKQDFEKLKSVILDGGKYSDSVDASTEFAKGVQEKRKMFKFKLLEGYRKATNWAMEQGDLIFARDAYARALAGYLKANGITETDYSKVDTQVLEDARLFAIKEAQEATFRDTNTLSGWISKVGRRRDTHKVGKLISEGVMPFRKTPANVLIRAEEYSPLGVINSVYYSVKAMQKGTDVTATQVINSWAKSLTGTGLFALGMLLQSVGCLAGGADDDESKDKFDSMNGWQNYAIVLPDGTNLTIDFLTPTAMPMLMGAELSQLMADDGFELKDLESALTSITEPMVQMSMLQGINDTLDNVKYSDNSLMQMAINSGLSYVTQGLTNTLLGQVERAFEDSRTTTYVDKDSAIPDWLQRTIGKVSAKIPGLDYNQIPYINAWGEEEEYGNVASNLAYNMLSPSYVDKGKEDAVSKELLRLNEVQSENVFPNTPAKSLSFTDVNNEPHKNYQLSAEEYVALTKTQGQKQRELVEAAIATTEYSLLSDTEKATVIKNIYKYAKEYARGEVIEGYTDDYGCFSSKWMSEIYGDVAEEIIWHTIDQRK